MSKWQPIETAPKTGRLVWLSDGFDVDIGHWTTIGKNQWGGLWQLAHGGFCDGDAWTHWMDLDQFWPAPSVSDEHPQGEDAIAAEGEACQRGPEGETP